MKLILFDSGYLIFNTIYRIEKKYNIDLNNSNFKRLYTNLFYSTIKKLLLKYEILKSNKIIIRSNKEIQQRKKFNFINQQSIKQSIYL